MRPAMLDELRRCTVGLTAPAFTRFARATLRITDPCAAVGLEDRLRILLWEWFTHLGYLPADQQQIGLRVAAPALLRLAAELRGAHDGPDLKADRLPRCRFFLAAHRYWNCPETTQWHDLEFDEPLEELPRPPKTIFIFDATAAYCELQDRLIALQEGRPFPG